MTDGWPREAVVYPRGSAVVTEVTRREARRGVTTVECPDCDGDGVFEVHDGHTQECVPCKGRGEVFISV